MKGKQTDEQAETSDADALQSDIQDKIGLLGDSSSSQVMQTKLGSLIK